MLLAIASKSAGQTHLSYADTTDALIQLTSKFDPKTVNDTVLGYAQRFDLPAGKHRLRSIDFVLDSIGSDSTAILVCPVKFDDKKHLPNLDGLRRIYTSQKFSSGVRATVDVGELEVDNSFFVHIASNRGATKYRARMRSMVFNFDSARSAYVWLTPPPLFEVMTDLVAGNLLPANFNVNLDYGVTYITESGTAVHLSAPTPRVFPNPVPVGLPVRVSGLPLVSAQVVDALGRTVYSERSNLLSPIIELSTITLPSGAYIAILRNVEGVESRVRFVVQ